MTVENFTTYTKVDPNSRISKTATKVTFTDLTLDETAYVYKDKGANYFSGDFIHYLTVKVTAQNAPSNADTAAVWALANALDDWQGLVVANEPLILVNIVIKTTGNPQIAMREYFNGADRSTFAPYTISLDTTYYLKVVRDESVGANGTLYLYIYSDAARTNLLNTQTDGLSAKTDFRYIFPALSRDINLSSYTVSGYSENLELDITENAPTVTTQAVSDILSRTATGNGNITDLGDGSVTQHGVCWNTGGTPTIADDKTEEGVAGTGAFTTNMTGLLPNTLYYVRAYATSEYGTSYGTEVSFTTLGKPYSQAHFIG